MVVPLILVLGGGLAEDRLEDALHRVDHRVHGLDPLLEAGHEGVEEALGQLVLPVPKSPNLAVTLVDLLRNLLPPAGD